MCRAAALRFSPGVRLWGQRRRRARGRAFEAFERVPVAAASLGQVHRASYKGEVVAVKVLRPGVERR